MLKVLWLVVVSGLNLGMWVLVADSTLEFTGYSVGGFVGSQVALLWANLYAGFMVWPPARFGSQQLSVKQG